MLQNGAKNGRKFFSLFDFQGGSLFLEKDEKNEKKKVEESDMISNIFDDANLGKHCI